MIFFISKLYFQHGTSYTGHGPFLFYTLHQETFQCKRQKSKTVHFVRWEEIFPTSVIVMAHDLIPMIHDTAPIPAVSVSLALHINIREFSARRGVVSNE